MQVEPDDLASLCPPAGGFFIALTTRPNQRKDLNREEKAAVVEEIAGQIEASESIFAIDYRGISVPQAAELRAKLREADASFRVVKNRITKLAAEKAGREQLTELLDGPTALTFVRGDIGAGREGDHDAWTASGRCSTSRADLSTARSLEEDEFKAIARLPGREALNAQLAGVVASPITGLVRGLELDGRGPGESSCSRSPTRAWSAARPRRGGTGRGSAAAEEARRGGSQAEERTG